MIKCSVKYFTHFFLLIKYIFSPIKQSVKEVCKVFAPKRYKKEKKKISH